VSISYVVAFAGDNAWMYDNVRPVGFAVAGTASAVSMGLVSFMWMQSAGGKASQKSKTLRAWRKTNYIVIFFGTLVNNLYFSMIGESQKAQAVNLLVVTYYGGTFLCGGRKIVNVMNQMAENTNSMNQGMIDNMNKIRQNSNRCGAACLLFSISLVIFISTNKVNSGSGSPMTLVFALVAQASQPLVSSEIINYVRFGKRERMAREGFFFRVDWSSGTDLAEEMEKRANIAKSQASTKVSSISSVGSSSGATSLNSSINSSMNSSISTSNNESDASIAMSTTSSTANEDV